MPKGESVKSDTIKHYYHYKLFFLLCKGFFRKKLKKFIICFLGKNLLYYLKVKEKEGRGKEMRQQYADFHFHTDFSPDSNASMEGQILAGKQRGMHYLCPTDHWDLVDEEHPTKRPPLSQWQGHISMLREKYAESSEFALLFGVEIGEGYVRPDLVQEAISGIDLDFIIASVHSVQSTDFAKGVGIYHATMGMKSDEEYQPFFQEYFKALRQQSETSYYDSFAHINYPFRYLPKSSSIKIEDYWEEVTEVMENIIKHDKVMELNTTRGQMISVWAPILKRYQELGGRYVTIGSDSHRHEDMSTGIEEAVALLKSLGFSSYVYFEKREKKEIPIL